MMEGFKVGDKVFIETCDAIGVIDEIDDNQKMAYVHAEMEENGQIVLKVGMFSSEHMKLI